MNDPNLPPAQSLANRLFDEGVMLIVRAAQAEGVRVSSKTALRWCIAGVRGVRLESVKVAGRRVTSRAAFRRFVAATQPASPTQPMPTRAILDRDATDRILRTYGLARDQLGR